MTELVKESTSYSVTNVGSTLVAEGQCTVSENGSIESMNLSFSDAGRNVGSANYDEREGRSHYNYSLSDDKYKAEVTSMLDTIIADIKAQTKNA